MDYFSLLHESKKIDAFLMASAQSKPQTVFGLTEGEIGVMLALLGRKTIVIAASEQQLLALQKQLMALKKECFFLPMVQEQPLYSLTSNGEQAEQAQRALHGFAQSKHGVLLVTATGALQNFAPLEQINSSVIDFKVGKKFGLGQLSKQLTLMGYEKTDRALSCGEFSVRGDIVDIWPEQSEHLHRLDFFGDELESIKVLDYASQSLLGKQKSLAIYPRSTMLLGEDSDLVVERMEAAFMAAGRKNTNTAFLAQPLEEVRQALLSGMRTQNLAFASVFTRRYSLLELFPNAAIAVCESHMVREKATAFYRAFCESVEDFEKSGRLLPEHKNFFNAPDVSFKFKDDVSRIEFKSLLTKSELWESEQVLEFVVSGRQKYNGKREMLIADVKRFAEQGKKVFLFAGSKGNANFLQSDIDFARLNEQVTVSEQTLPLSALFSSEQLILIGTDDLFVSAEWLATSSQSKTNAFFLPKVGDFVVHSTHGIGKCIALERLKFAEFEKDYIVLEYANGDKLYLPSEQANMISAFRGGEKSPQLNKLGGTEFFKSKQKVRASVKAKALDMAQLYRDRDERKGIAFPPNNWMYAELEESFAFELTTDQKLAIAAVTADMESEKVMDRLICGDVGFGKTEVAIRAIYKAVSSGKQVAFLCPTTILAEQHYLTCQARFAQFGIRIKVLSRFRTPREQKQILIELKEHKIDLIIGTHRLLSKDVVFADLGLLVLDEEQRFGVSHKEQIKHAKTSIDTISMSATPIPRTLHMALSGIRDISVIETPPASRLAIRTTVTEYSDSLLQYACNKELERGGQVLIVINRVAQIEGLASKVRTLVPQAKVGVAHGQMIGRELEQVMLKLTRKELDIVVATTLIENGIDLPKANTLFVMDAGHLGLSQLYQLRGRVGRSDRQAYAYLTFKGNRDMSDESHKRLAAIGEFTELGSGFKIAMRDLEIRGAGDVLGSMQHGHMQKIGYDMYCKILSEVASELKGETLTEQKEIAIEVNANAFLPEAYVSGSEERIALFSKIAICKTAEEERLLLKSMLELFGEVPLPVKNLVGIARLKNNAQNIGVKKVKISFELSELLFHSGTNPFADGIIRAVQKHASVCTMKGGNHISIQFKNHGNSVTQKIDFMTKFCAACASK